MSIFVLFHYHDVENIVYFLKHNNFNVNEMDWRNESPLMYACYRKWFKIVKILIDQGTDIHYQIQNSNAFGFACLGGNIKIIKYLIKKGISKNCILFGIPLLDVLSTIHLYKFIKKLLKLNIKPQTDNIKYIKYLIKHDLEFISSLNIDKLIKKRNNNIVKYMFFQEIHLCDIIKKLII